ncbi:hypothetical protein LCGC14_0282990 [marine sediment metagenome]|uniref:Uncharacterized protein n=1 Tax=marine sediment metagenome TaxID=412755 RepID=A0A0F9TVS4_9ZZZZ
MPLKIDNETVFTSHASKTSKVSLKIIEAHTSVLVPLLVLPLSPTLFTLKIVAVLILILVLLERKGWTMKIAIKRFRSKLAGRYRSRKTRSQLIRRMNRR